MSANAARPEHSRTVTTELAAPITGGNASPGNLTQT
jgi:hypothetical protein